MTTEPQKRKSEDDGSAVPEGPKPPKAYKNSDFLNSNNARMVRIMCELQEPGQRLEAQGVDNIVMFFGSARAKPKPQYEQAVLQAEAAVAARPEDAGARAALDRLKKQAFLVPMFDVTTELARRLTEWSQSRAAEGKARYAVGTGAGPGMMEAANKGAHLAQGPSAGFGISLPFEDRLNPYVTPELGFEFHYFFTRKFWMCYKCMGLVVAPGGLGTCDELFELMTLMQTGKIKRKLPLILIGKQFWKACINWEAFVEYGMISEADAKQLIFVDTADEAFKALTDGILAIEEAETCKSPLKQLRIGGSTPAKLAEAGGSSTAPKPVQERIAILDAGSQFGKVIDRRVRELKVFSEIVPLGTPAAELIRDGYSALIISGGPGTANAADAPAYDPALFSCGLPVLGICYGMQMLNHHFKGTVERKGQREDGQEEIDVVTSCPLFAGLDSKQKVLLTHGDTVEEVASGFTTIATSGALCAGIGCDKRKLYGVQFHPEVDLSVNGMAMLRNFLFGVCGLRGLFTPASREDQCIQQIRDRVGGSKVLCLVSGGVDSTVCCALLAKALGPENVVAAHIDNGFMRLNESALVGESLKSLGVQLRVYDCEEDFLSATTEVCNPKTKVRYTTKPLRETHEPEDKRRIIGDTFMHVSERIQRELGLDPENTFLAQGTLRPDLIESASSLVSSKADAIKTHHNDTELVRELRKKGRVIEPLMDYHKDEVRELGMSLGLPKELVMRQPFPGPGLGVRLICLRQPYVGDDFQKTNVAVQDIVALEAVPAERNAFRALVARTYGSNSARLHGSGLSATLLPFKTVGVQGDGRTYSYPCVLSGPGKPDWPLLMEFARLIPKVCHNVNRVVYSFGGPAPGPYRRITPTLPGREALDQLRAADDVVNRTLIKYDLTTKLSQVPVVSFPVEFSCSDEHPGGRATTERSIAIRTFITNDFMTGVPAEPGSDYMPLEVLEEMVQGIQKVPGISRVVYDLTSKPPGTTEWE